MGNIHSIIDRHRAEQYISNMTEQEKELITAILRDTTYITLNEFLEKIPELDSKLSDILTRDQKFFYIHVPEKQGSEQWILSMIPLTRSNPYFKGVFTTLPSDYKTSRLVFIDDVVYSGNNILGYIDHLIVDLPDDYDYNYDFYHRGPDIDILIGIIYSTAHGIIMIEQALKQQFRIGSVSIVNIGTLPSYDFSKFDSSLLDSFVIERSSIPTIFEHKMPNEHGSFPQIYVRGFIPSKMMDFGPIITNIPKPPYRS